MLLGDEPFCKEKDPLGFDAIAGHLTGLILQARDSSPFTLGVEGGWGTGKSSLMRRIEPKLRDEDKGIKTVWFNAWAVADGQALEGLIKSVLAKLDSNVLRRAARNKQLVGWGKLALSLVGGWFGLGSLVNSVWSAVEVDPKARNDLQDLMKQAMDEWLRKGPEPANGRLLVVFIDDLDRCSPENVFQIFEAVKVHLSTRGMVFVVGYDKDIVSDAVLKEKHYSASITGTDYLEKIIQISYRMPRPSDTAGAKLIDSYVRDSRTKRLFSDPTIKALALELNERNPRRIKRFINAFILEWGLDAEWAQEKFHPAVVMRVVILYMYFAEFESLLEKSEQEDPVEKFEDYVALRAALWQPPQLSDSDARDAITKFTSTYGLRSVALGDPLDRNKAIEAIDKDKRLPDRFPELAEHDQFKVLLEGLGDGEDRARLLAKLRRTRPSERAQAAGTRVSPSTPSQPIPAPRGAAPYRLSLESAVEKQRLEDSVAQNAIVFHTAGSTGGIKNPQPQLAVARAMLGDFDDLTTTPMFMYLLGDVVYFNGAAKEYFPQFYEPYSEYSAPIFAIPGNHDADNGDDPSTPSLAAFVDNFCATSPVPTPESRGARPAMTQPNVYWTLRAPFTTIIGLYSNVPIAGYFDRTQLKWLIGELTDAPPDDAVIVALHHDPYSVGVNLKGSMQMVTDLDDAFATAGRAPDLVLSANVHNYQRFTRTIDGRSVSYVVAGAGGYHNLHRVAASASRGMQLESVVLDQFSDDRYGFLRVTSSPGSLRGEYVAVEVGEEHAPMVLDSFTMAVGADARADRPRVTVQ